MSSNDQIILRARRWLDNTEFREILKIADYMGYQKGAGALFKINVKKILSNNYTFEDIINIINEYDLEIKEGNLDYLREIIEEKTKITIDVESTSNDIIMKIPWNVWNILKEQLRGIGIRFYNKDQEAIYYTFKPYKLSTVIELVKGKGINIEDKTGITKEKTLAQKLEFRGELRPYQQEALEKWSENNYRGVIALPTGSGKTIIAIAGLAKVQRRTLIVTYTKEQMFQWREMIIKFTNIAPELVGLYYTEEKKLAPITITTYQSAFRNIEFMGRYFDLLIVDECHHLPAEKFKHIAMYSIAPFRMGLSATVVREDGKHTELFPLMGGIIYHKSAAELAQQGYLARYRVYTIKVGLSSKERKEYKELYKIYKTLAGGRSFQEILEAAKLGDTKAQQALRIHSRLRMLVANSENKILKAVEIAEKELKKGNKIIIFTQYVNQAKEISKRLGAYLLTGEIDTKERQRVLKEFKEKPSGVLVVTTVGDEGLDIPDANVGIIVSGTGSRRQFIQRLGRLLRPREGKNEAKLYEIVISGTADEFLARKRKTILEGIDEFL
ncbi:DEAD/DEAH box helicase [Desulfurococcaceae archaeon MEX13E-LK6-19]|nr:DEAD/DEAH box helicase [Desulfurococcaceae archaeon MEX13E-LK6-19]